MGDLGWREEFLSHLSSPLPHFVKRGKGFGKNVLEAISSGLNSKNFSLSQTIQGNSPDRRKPAFQGLRQIITSKPSLLPPTPTPSPPSVTLKSYGDSERLVEASYTLHPFLEIFVLKLLPETSSLMTTLDLHLMKVPLPGIL